jgi:predicted helicase
VYLTNALEPPRQYEASFAVPALAHEAEAVNRIKRHQPITVVIGNPPYSGVSSNMAPWIDGLLKGSMPDGTSTASYYHVDGKPLGERKLWLQDDYVKFIRWSQWRLQSTGVGVHGFITNHGYIDNPTFRGMRWSIMDSFDTIHVLDLHGNLKKKETPPDGGKDINVFDIQQGVGIGLFVRKSDHHAGIDGVSVRHADLWGEREAKYRWLIDHTVTDTDWQTMPVTVPFYLFEPFDQSEAGDYSDWPAINDIMQVNVTGIVTARDDFVIDFDEKPLRLRMADLRNASLTDKVIREKYFAGKGSEIPSGRLTRVEATTGAAKAS